jgi:hypothetical protein
MARPALLRCRAEFCISRFQKTGHAWCTNTPHGPDLPPVGTHMAKASPNNTPASAQPETPNGPRKTIEAYRAQHNEELDEHAGKVLERLAGSHEAVKAFERLKPKDDSEAAIIRARQWARTRGYLKRLKKGNPEVVKAIEQLKPVKAVDGQGAIIRACIEAENLARTFPERAKKAKGRSKRRRRERLSDAAATLRSFLNEIISEQQKPLDPLWIRPKAPEDVAAMRLGLATFERWIEYVEEHVAELNLFRLRVSRKSEAPSKALSAGQFAAIGRLAEEVKRVTGKAHYEEIADLAGVIFGTEVFPEQVRRAAQRARGHWQWVKPKLNTTARSRAK